MKIFARIFKFGIVGGTGVLVNAGLLYLFTECLGLRYRISSIIAIECAIVNNFTWNFRWTWADRRADGATPVTLLFLKFNLGSGLVALAVNWGLLVFLTEKAGLYYQAANLIGILCGVAANFLLTHLWTFAAPAARAETRA
ncbi:MAG: GtrA family protein [Fibrobacteres bacterium]|nr:GtrA family protein [Fibrobacterota bacterium]